LSSRPKRSEEMCCAPFGSPESSVTNPQHPNKIVIPTEAQRRDVLCAFRLSRILRYKPPTPKQNCHPDRSAAKWRDLLFPSATNQPSLRAPPLPFVNPTGAEDPWFRSRSNDSHECDEAFPIRTSSLGSTDAFRTSPVHIANANPKSQSSLCHPTEAQCGGICGSTLGRNESRECNEPSPICPSPLWSTDRCQRIRMEKANPPRTEG
jgi:hypothetical protein